MKKTRKICSLVIALCLAVSLFVLPVSAAFSDVAGGRWYSESVDWASAAGYVSGYEDGTFRLLGLLVWPCHPQLCPGRHHRRV